MRWFRLVCVVSFLMVCSGCLVSEVTEYKLALNADGKSGTFTTVMRHVESDSPDTSAQRKDFSTLIENWKGDRYLLEQMDKNLYVKERKLFMEKGKLAWRESSIFSDVTKLIPGFSADSSVRFPLTDTSALKITTNGKLIVTRDSIFILWPPHTRTFEMKSANRNFTATSNFARLFQAYARK